MIEAVAALVVLGLLLAGSVAALVSMAQRAERRQGSAEADHHDAHERLEEGLTDPLPTREESLAWHEQDERRRKLEALKRRQGKP